MKASGYNPQPQIRQGKILLGSGRCRAGITRRPLHQRHFTFGWIDLARKQLARDAMAQAVTAADRIRELNNINEDVSSMLKAAGLAINTLTGRDPPSQAGDDAEMTDASAATSKSSSETFETHVTEYYTKLQAVIARLRRQAYALEEAGIISVEATALTSSGATAAPRNDAMASRGASPVVTSTEPARLTNGGLGNLDIGWLNSRGNKVATEKEHEIMIEAKELLQDMLASNDPAREDEDS